MIAERLPAVADHVEAQLAEEGAPRGSVGELKEYTRILVHAGFVGRPSWVKLRGGSALCEFRQRVWRVAPRLQHHVSSVSEHHFRESMVLRQSCAADQAHLRSHGGDVLSGALTGPEFRMCPELFRIFVFEHLRLPLEVVELQCECGTVLHNLGRRAVRQTEPWHVILWRSAFLGWRRSWSRMLAVSCAGPSQFRWWPCQPPPSPGLTAPHLTWPTSSRCEGDVKSRQHRSSGSSSEPNSQGGF